MYHGVSEGAIIPSAQGYEPNVPGLEFVTVSRITVVQPQGQHDPQEVAPAGDAMSPRMQMNVL
eukprot:11412720-Prorocentrum_lima.AAC.1